jgi:hypothetical protein
MESVRHIISGSLSVGPAPSDRSDAETGTTGAFLAVLLQTLSESPAPVNEPVLDDGVLGDEDEPASFLAFTDEPIRTEPPTSADDALDGSDAEAPVAQESVAPAGPPDEEPPASPASPDETAATTPEPIREAAPADDSAARGGAARGPHEAPSANSPSDKTPLDERRGVREETESLEEGASRRADHVPFDLPQPRVDTGHGTVVEARDGTGHDAPLTSAEVEGNLLSAIGPGAEAPVATPAAPVDGVSAVESASGAGVAGGQGPLVGSAEAKQGGVSSEASAEPAAPAIEKLDAPFQEVFSAARARLDLRERIELARSVGRQVIERAVVSLRNGRTQVEVQLRPPTLGTVRMQLVVERRQVSAKLSVDNLLVREVVERHLWQLRSVLRQEGFHLDRFEVSVRSETGAESWASAQAGGRTAAAEVEEALDEPAATASPGVEATGVSVHDGTVDYLA